MTTTAAMQARNELIAYVPRQLLDEQRWLVHGFLEDPQGLIHETLGSAVAFAPRGPLEDDPSRKQIIPYVVVHNRAGQIFTLQRKRAQTEARLHDKLSFGVGGHIEHIDQGAGHLIDEGMRRELHEELQIEGPYRVSYRGILNDDSNAVGQVHLGAIYTCTAEVVAVGEVDKMEGRWWTLDELRAASGRLETWSALLLDHLPQWLGLPTP